MYFIFHSPCSCILDVLRHYPVKRDSSLWSALFSHKEIMIKQMYVLKVNYRYKALIPNQPAHNKPSGGNKLGIFYIVYQFTISNLLMFHFSLLLVIVFWIFCDTGIFNPRTVRQKKKYVSFLLMLTTSNIFLNFSTAELRFLHFRKNACSTS